MDLYRSDRHTEKKRRHPQIYIRFFGFLFELCLYPLLIIKKFHFCNMNVWACAQNVKKYSAFFRTRVFTAVFAVTNPLVSDTVHNSQVLCNKGGQFRVMTPIIQVDSFLKNFKDIYLSSLYITCRLHGPPISSSLS
jgi:hypothetical protein